MGAMISMVQRLVYACVTWGLYPLALLMLRIRLARGKECPNRWREKLGRAGAKRPNGRLVWIHGVGLGEVLSARSVIDQMAQRDPDLQFLVTSSTRQSAQVFEQHMPGRCIHQFLPLDSPPLTRRFLNHWRPNQSIWIEQDFWPNLIFQTAARGIPLVLLNGRMGGRSFHKRNRWRGVYRAAYAKFALLGAQDAQSAKNITRLSGLPVTLHPSLKSIAPPLRVDSDALQHWKTALDGRFVWCVGSAHMADAQAALQAHQAVVETHPNATLVIIPRYLTDCPQFTQQAQKFTPVNAPHGVASDVIIETRMGQSGLWYALSHMALMGGSFDTTGGHNPWEAINQNCPVLYGPNVQNFQADFSTLTTAGAAHQVQNAHDLATKLLVQDVAIGTATQDCIKQQQAQLDPLFDRIMQLFRVTP